MTQFVLGSTVAAALLGPRIGARKAVLIGGVLGTLPDLDSFVPTDDAVDAFVSHRGATHSVLVQAVAAPVFAEPLVRLLEGLRNARMRTYLAVYLVFATHALIDTMTVYGTRTLWPLVDEPLGVGSIFIIDPLYTLPLLIITLWALFVSGWPERLRRWTAAALIASSAYMALTVPLQTLMTHRAERILAENGVAPERLLAIPAPFNVLFWKVIAIDGGRYVNLYMPVFGADAASVAHMHPRRDDLIGCLETDADFLKLAAFSFGFYSIATDADGRVIVSDLRMGLTPAYAFRFAVARMADGMPEPIEPPERIRSSRESPGDWDWLAAGLAQAPVPRPAEAGTQVALDALAAAGRHVAAASCSATAGTAS